MREKTSRTQWICRLLGALFSLFLTYGLQRDLGQSVIIFFIFFVIFSLIVRKVFQFFDSGKLLKGTEVKWKHPFLFSLLLILLCWLPYIIAYYPAILNPDSEYQIKQFYGIPSKYDNYAVMIDPDMHITNHHPVPHTLLLGTCTKIGDMLGSVNGGLFLYSMIQITLLSLTLAFTIYYMQKIKTPLWTRITALACYAFLPFFPYYAMTAVKDVIYACFIVLYMILLYELIRRREQPGLSRKWIAISIILMILICLFRNNGVYVIVLSFPFLFFIDKKKRKMLAVMFLSCICLYGVYNKVILPACRITPTSVREALSIPFQQTARYVKSHEKEMSKKEKEVIDKVLDIDTLAERYDPELSDPVKNKYNIYATKEDLSNYFKVWFQQFFKDPGLYVAATVENTSGYFCPNKIDRYVYHRYNHRIVKDGLDYHYLESRKDMRTALHMFAMAFQVVPATGIFVNIGMYTWMMLLLAGYLISKKRYKELIFLLPVFATLLICVASPANTYFRYTLPMMFGMPLIIGGFMRMISDGGIENGKENSSTGALL